MNYSDCFLLNIFLIVLEVFVIKSILKWVNFFVAFDIYLWLELFVCLLFFDVAVTFGSVYFVHLSFCYV